MPWEHAAGGSGAPCRGARPSRALPRNRPQARRFWTAAVFCRFRVASEGTQKRQRTAAVQNATRGAARVRFMVPMHDPKIIKAPQEPTPSPKVLDCGSPKRYARGGARPVHGPNARSQNHQGSPGIDPKPEGFGLRQSSAAFAPPARGQKSGRGLPQSKTLRGTGTPGRGSGVQCAKFRLGDSFRARDPGLRRNPGHRPHGLSPGLSSGGPLGREAEQRLQVGLTVRYHVGELGQHG